MNQSVVSSSISVVPSFDTNEDESVSAEISPFSLSDATIIIDDEAIPCVALCEVETSNDINKVLQAHDNYIANLIKADKRYKPCIPKNLLFYPCDCGNNCNATLSM